MSTLTLFPGIRTRRTTSTTAALSGSTMDAHQKSSDGTGYSDGGDTVLFVSSTVATDRYVGGLAFPSVAIPAGAVILTAHITGVSFGSKYDDFNCDIRFEDRDSAPVFDSTTDSPYTRMSGTLLTAVQWTAINQGTDVAVQSPDLAVPVQAVVNRPGWGSGASIGVLLVGRSDATYLGGMWSWDHATFQEPRLVVEYLS